MPDGQDFPLGGGPMTPSVGAPGAVGGGQVTPQQVIEWMGSIYGDPDTAGYYFSENPQGWTDYYRESMGLGEGESDLERRSTEAGIAVNEAHARRIIAKLGGNTYEDMRQRMIDKIDEEHWDKNHAVTEFNALMSATLDTYDEEMKRKAYTRPGSTWERPAHKQVMESYGLEYTPQQGVPTSQLPSMEDMYGRWSGVLSGQSGGSSQQGMGGGMGGGASGPAAARSYIDELLARHQGQLGVGSWPRQ